jgi:hypothetical protein
MSRRYEIWARSTEHTKMPMKGADRVPGLPIEETTEKARS